ncbi:hypothetical protein D3C80_1732510 [compost metagenome]
MRFLRGRERIGASVSRRSGLDLVLVDRGGFVIPTVQQKNVKEIVTIQDLSPLSTPLSQADSAENKFSIATSLNPRDF